jgi:hypothetical protein
MEIRMTISTPTRPLNGPTTRFRSPLDPTARPLPLRLMFVEEPPAAGQPPANKPEMHEAGFPLKTPWEQMEPDQKVAYWRHYSQTHEREANSRPTRDEFDRQAAELATLRNAGLPQEQRELQEKLDTARREGENAGADRYLSIAVRQQIQLETGQPREVVEKALVYADSSKFKTATGDLDLNAIKEFSAVLGAQAVPPAPVDPLAAHLNGVAPISTQPGVPVDINAAKQAEILRATGKAALTVKPL